MQVGLVKFMTTTGEKEKVEGSNNSERAEMNEGQASVNGVSSPASIDNQMDTEVSTAASDSAASAVINIEPTSEDGISSSVVANGDHQETRDRVTQALSNCRNADGKGSSSKRSSTIGNGLPSSSKSGDDVNGGISFASRITHKNILRAYCLLYSVKLCVVVQRTTLT
jgi:hypothetical protein